MRDALIAKKQVTLPNNAQTIQINKKGLEEGEKEVEISTKEEEDVMMLVKNIIEEITDKEVKEEITDKEVTHTIGMIEEEKIDLPANIRLMMNVEEEEIDKEVEDQAEDHQDQDLALILILMIAAVTEEVKNI